jgi:hypothetical protein
MDAAVVGDASVAAGARSDGPTVLALTRGDAPMRAAMLSRPILGRGWPARP